MDKTTKIIYRISMVILAVILVVINLVLFTGEIHVAYEDTAFTINADHYDDLTVEYNSIDSMELRNASIPGTRSFGFGSARLLLGIFENEEFGMYTRYTYTKSDCAIVITSKGKVLVLAGDNAEETKAIYETLLSKTGLGG